jgi:hypothetical protein
MTLIWLFINSIDEMPNETHEKKCELFSKAFSLENVNFLDGINNSKIISHHDENNSNTLTNMNNEFDEYPMASTQEGGNISSVGKTISVKWLPFSENRSAGGTLATTVYLRHNMHQGDPFLAITVPNSGIK